MSKFVSLNRLATFLDQVKKLIPTVSNSTITINQAGNQKGAFTLNQSGDTTINLDGGDDKEEIRRILLSGFEDGTKVFSDDGTVITSTASDGRTLTKTFTDSFTVMTVVLASAEGTEIARMVKTFSTDGKTISVTVTYAEG